MAVTIKSDRLQLGPGKLWVAPLTTIADADLDDFTVTSGVFSDGFDSGEVPGDATWLPLGATNEGTAINTTMESANVEVAESYDPVAIISTGKGASLNVGLVTFNITTYLAAFNASSGAWAGTPGATASAIFTPPAVGQEVRRQIMWVSDKMTDIVVFFQAFQAGSIEEAHRKGADKGVMNCEFRAEIPPTAVANSAWKRIVCGAAWAATANTE
jgi:hypothetical protein